MKSFLQGLLPVFDRKWKNVRAVCGLRTCQNKMLMRAVPQNRTGINAGDVWYCSVDCFVSSARMRFSALPGRPTEMPHSPRLSVGLVMLSKGYLTDDQLRTAVEQSQRRGEDLEVSLIRLGLAGERQIAAARAAQWGYPFFGSERTAQAIEVDIPVSLLREYFAAPLHYSAGTNRLVLGFVYRVEHSFLHSLEQITGYRVEPCFITRTEFKEQMERVTGAADWDEVYYEESGTPAQMARILGSHAVEIAATEATFAQCRNFSWARLCGKRGKIDIILRVREAVNASRMNTYELLQESMATLG